MKHISVTKWVAATYQFQLDWGVWARHFHFNLYLDIWRLRLHIRIGQR